MYKEKAHTLRAHEEDDGVRRKKFPKKKEEPLEMAVLASITHYLREIPDGAYQHNFVGVISAIRGM